MVIVKLTPETLTPAQLAQLEALEQQCGLEPYTREMLLECIGNMDTYAAMEEERILGFVTIHPGTRYLDGGLYIVNLNVAPICRRQGLGRKLMLTACSFYMGSHGQGSVTLDVAKSNVPALSLYRALGFEITDLPSGNGDTDVVMMLSLKRLLGILHTPRLTLRPFAQRDAAQVMEIMQNKEVSKTYLLPDLDDEGARSLFSHLMSLSIDGTHYVKGICLDGTCIGWINEVERSGDRIEIGWVIHPAHQNRGYATEAVRAAKDALLRKGFQSVIAGAFEDNLPSLRVMEKAGMHRIDKIDMLEYRGNVHKCIYYSIEKGEAYRV